LMAARAKLPPMRRRSDRMDCEKQGGRGSTMIGQMMSRLNQVVLRHA
jgi:hypothetical protein